MSTASISVRPARAGDLGAIAAFNAAMAVETEERELDRAVLARGVTHAFEDPARGRYFVAESRGRVVGCLMVTREWSDWRDGWFWWIQSVYVAPEARGGGAYSALHGHVREAAQAAGDVVGLRLYAERHNERAQRTYRRLGMVETGYLLFEEMLV
ncbi:MAG: GNAT family N-acetyltransferase [Thermoanaerobaculia bacterium]|nr:MAG: GNAT family N-acetyltransferase [Thermoanaerobaculia bacterium]